MPRVVFNDPDIDYSQVLSLYNECGWNKDLYRDISKTSLAFKNSLCYCTSYLDNSSKIIGIVRLVGDGVYIIQLADLVVSDKYRKQGVGKELVKCLLDNYLEEQKDKSIMLVDGSGIKTLYKSLGFTKSPSETVYYL